MKVLLVNVNAVSGSTGKIVTDTKNVLEAQGHDCLIAYGANETVNDKNYFRICPEIERKFNSALSRLSGIYYGCFTAFSFERLKRLIRTYQPDIVHLHCANGYIIDLFKTLKFLAENKIKTVVTNHAEFYYTGGCGHAFDCEKWMTGCSECQEPKYGRRFPIDNASYVWRNFKSVFEKFQPENLIVTSVSPWVTERAKKSPYLSKFRHRTVLNGLNTEVFHHVLNKKLQEKLPCNRPIILHVTPNFSISPLSIKGGRYVIELARIMPDCTFVVAATNSSVPTEALPDNMILWGRAKNQQELAQLYSLADVTVIASKRETFNMTVAESLCCGTPVVGFKAGGPESIALPQYSSFVDYGDVWKLSEKLKLFLEIKTNKVEVSESAIKQYSSNRMTSDYLSVYTELLNK